MNKVIEIRTAIEALLNTLHSRVYFNAAPDDVVFPYIVYNLPNSIDTGTLENFVLDVDFWDVQADTTTLETLANTVDAALNKKVIVIDDKLNMAIYRNNRLNITDDDPRIRRRKYIYQARTYQKYY